MDVMTGVFGTWDAPITDDLPPIPTPVGRPCLWCAEPIREGDNGRVTEPDVIAPDGHVEHRECAFRSVAGGIGHLVDHDRYCRAEGPDAGLSRRQSALLVWAFMEETRMEPTADQRAGWALLITAERSIT